MGDFTNGSILDESGEMPEPERQKPRYGIECFKKTHFSELNLTIVVISLSKRALRVS